MTNRTKSLSMALAFKRIFAITFFISTSFLHVVNGMECPMSLEEMIENSGEIFTGRVISKHSKWQNKMIVTEVTFEVDEQILGDEKNYIKLNFFGGSVGGTSFHFCLSPEFKVGEELLLMRDKNKNSVTPVFGSTHGKYSKSSFSSQNKQKSLNELNDEISFNQFRTLIKQMLGRKNEGVNLKSTTYTDAKKLMKKMHENNHKHSHRKKLSFSTHGTLTSTPWSITPVQSGIATLGDSDQRMMAEWNRFSNIFTTSPATGTWNYQNGISEVAGFTTNAQLSSDPEIINPDGSPISWGVGTLAFVLPVYAANSEIVETDMFINPDIPWTDNNDEAVMNNGLVPIDLTVLHELGHCISLDHEFADMSVMNYTSVLHYGDPYIRTDDANAVRTLFPTLQNAITDSGIYFFKAGNGAFTETLAQMSAAVLTQNTTFSVSDFTLENTGTTELTGFTIRWFFSPQLRSLTNAVEIGTTTHTLSAGTSTTTETATLTTPSTITNGEYYLAATVEASGDEVEANNTNWLLTPVTISDQSVVAHAGADQSVQAGVTVTLDGTASAGDSLTYAWEQTSGTTVTLSSSSAASPTFTSPGSVGTLEFTLTVTSGTVTATDSVTITVVAATVSEIPTLSSSSNVINTFGGAPPRPSSVDSSGGCFLKSF